MSHFLIRQRVLLQGLGVVLHLLGLIGSSQGDPLHGNHTKQYDPVTRPAFPVPQRAWITTFDCGKYFPGTPAWNFCFQKFHSGLMQNIFRHPFQPNYFSSSFIPSGTTGNMQGQGGGMNRGASFASSGGNFFGGGGMSSSNSYTAGYAINAINMGISSSQQNNDLKITLHTGKIDSFDMKTDQNVITLTIMSQGVQKTAKITVPKEIKVADVKVEKYADAVYINAPVPANSGGGSYQASSAGVGYGAGQFSQFHTGSGSGHTGASQEFLNTDDIFGTANNNSGNQDQNGFGNPWQNMFQDMFRFRRNAPVQNERQNFNAQGADPNQPMWFY